MKQHYLDLMQLHGSLELVDKRRLRQQLEARGAGREMELLQELNGAIRCSESEWLKWVAAKLGWTVNEVAGIRAALVEAIQELMMARHEAQDPVMQVLRLLREARSLFLQSFAVPAMRLLQRAARIARRLEEYELLALVRHQMNIVSQDIGPASALEMAEDLPSWPQMLEELKVCHELRSLVLEVAGMVRRRDGMQESRDRLLQVRDDVRELLRDHQLSFRPRAIGLVLLGVLESVTGDKEEALAIRLVLNDHYLAYPEVIQLWLGPYAGNLYNLVGSLSQLGRWDEVDDLIAQLQAIPTTYSKLASRHTLQFLSARTLNLRMLIFLQRRHYEQGLATFAQEEPRLQDNGMDSIQELHLGAYLAAAAMYLETWQHQRARAVIRATLEKYDQDLRKDLRLILKVIEIVSLVRDDEGEYIQYKIGNLLRPLRRSKGLLRQWGRVAELAGRMYFAPNPKARGAIWSASESIWTDAAGQGNLLFERAREWVESSFGQLKP